MRSFAHEVKEKEGLWGNPILLIVTFVLLVGLHPAPLPCSPHTTAYLIVEVERVLQTVAAQSLVSQDLEAIRLKGRLGERR